jgi:hypothetical protein
MTQAQTKDQDAMQNQASQHQHLQAAEHHEQASTQHKQEIFKKIRVRKIDFKILKCLRTNSGQVLMLAALKTRKDRDFSQQSRAAYLRQLITVSQQIDAVSLQPGS